MRSRWVLGLLLFGLACAARPEDRYVAAPTPPPAPPPAVAAAPAPAKSSGVAPEPWGIRGEPPKAPDPSYAEVVGRVEAMTRDRELAARLERRGLSVVNVAWEDTGRASGSALGPNISDLTLQVPYPGPGRGPERTALMPVIRFPNFTDRTGDIRANKLFVRVGNHKKQKTLETKKLGDVLRNLRAFVSVPRSVKGTGSFLAKRDTHFLVSAQAVFLPIPKTGKATFNPVVFNYQSAPESPAVLTLLVSRQGTSMTVIDNRPEDASAAGWGQELYFNAAGKRAAFTAERRSDVAARIERQGGPKSDDDRSALESGADVLFLIQVPLVHRHAGVLGGLWGDAIGESFGAGGLGLSGSGSGGGGVGTLGHGAGIHSDVERAVLGHGEKLGPFHEGRNLRLVRDARFPIRVTVQFYKATSNGVVSDADLDAITRSIGSVYEHADFVGSLVVPRRDRNRPTEWEKIPGEWFPW
jgi:hypothetical protein